MSKRSHCTTLLVLLLLLPLGGCLFRSRKVERRVSTAALREATQQDLINFINEQAGKIQTLNANVEMRPTVGGEKKGKITEYQEIKGYILVRKPDMLRMIGLFPVVRNRAFDMVSNGTEFKLWVPARNRFIVGRNDVILPTKQPLENLRPQHIFDALLLRPIDPANEIAVMEAGTEIVLDPKSRKEIEQPDYTITVIRRENEAWVLSRKIVFSRGDLLPHRQIVYGKDGHIATDAQYEKFEEHKGIVFPHQISIWRPHEEYAVMLVVDKLKLNERLRDDQFALAQPAGAQVVRLDQPQTSEMRGDGPKQQ
jgi:hypothetical protein